MAWEGKSSGTGQDILVEAAAYRGRPTYFYGWFRLRRNLEDACHEHDRDCGHIFQGTASDLSRDLQTVTGRVAPFLESKGQTKDPKALSKSLRRLIPSLRHAGVEIEFLPRSAKKQPISIKNGATP